MVASRPSYGLKTTDDVENVTDDHPDRSLPGLSTHAPGEVEESAKPGGILHQLALHVALDQNRLVVEQGDTVVVQEDSVQRLEGGGTCVHLPKQVHRLACPKVLIVETHLLPVVARNDEDDENLGTPVPKTGDDVLLIAP